MVLYLLNVVEDLKSPYEGNPAWALVIGWLIFGIFIAAVIYGFMSPLPAEDAKAPGRRTRGRSLGVEMCALR